MLRAKDIFRVERNISKEQLEEHSCISARQWVLIGYHSKKLPQAVHSYGISELDFTGFIHNIHSLASHT